MGGAGGPPSGFDPAVAALVEKVASTLNDVNARLDIQNARLNEQKKSYDEITEVLKKHVKESENIEATYKKTVELGKKLQAQNLKEYKDAQKARKELEEMAKLHIAALKNAKAGSKEAQVMTRNLTNMERLMKEIGKATELNETQFSKFRDIVGETARNAQDLVKAMYNLGRTGAALKGVSGVLGSMGIGRDFNRKMERRMEQVQEVKDKVAESRDIRKAATTKHMKKKRDKFLDEMKGTKGALGVNPETGEVMENFDEKGGLTKGGRDTLAKKMGFTRGTKEYSQFIGGEAAMGAGKAPGANYGAAMEKGGGAIEGLMSGFEGGIDMLMGGLEAFALPIAALVAAVEILTSIFETYVKQNQEMEKSIGKGGLFTQPGVGAGTAFMNAREGLRPKMGTGTTELGINFERNLAIAGAMADSGFASAQGLGTGEAGPGAANMGLGPGQQDEFMKGGVGEVQRTVMGVSRVGGLNDQEGVEQVMKLLGEYRETMASSEGFMARVNKDTAAAGISTTKYLKIIDEVSGSFDKMGKSLEQVTGVMRELSRYGSISSESLKDMMDFMENGQQKTTMGNVQTAAFTQKYMDKDTLDALRDVQKDTLTGYVQDFNDEGAKHGMSPLDVSAAIKKGDYAGAQGQANLMRDQITAMPDSTVKQTMKDNLQKIQDQINRVSGDMSPDFLKRAASQSLNKENPAETMANLFSNIKTAAGKSGISMTDLMSNAGSGQQSILMQQLAEQLGVKPGALAEAFRPFREEANNRVKDVETAATPEKKTELAKGIFTEIYKGAKSKGGIPLMLTGKGEFAKYWKGNMEDTFSEMNKTKEGQADMIKMFYSNLDVVAGSKETLTKILKSNSDGRKEGADGIQDQINLAKGVGSRTQSVGDLLSNTFKPLLIKLIHGIEGIASVVSKWFGHDVKGAGSEDAQQFAAQKEGEMTDVGKAIDALSLSDDTQQAALVAFQKAHTNSAGKMSQTDADQADAMSQQIQIGNDTFKKLEEIKDTGAFKTDAQESLVMKQVGNILGGGKAGKMEGAGLQAVTINNYYSSMVQHDTVPPSGGNVSDGEHADASKAKAAQ